MDNLKRKLFLKFELKRVLLKSLIKNSNLPLTYRYFIFYQKTKTPRWAILPQIVNRCTRTGRAMSVKRRTGYSRFVFRIESYSGHLPGYKRASW
jgi:ribosomal protein S14